MDLVKRTEPCYYYELGGRYYFIGYIQEIIENLEFEGNTVIRDQHLRFYLEGIGAIYSDVRERCYPEWGFYAFKERIENLKETIPTRTLYVIDNHADLQGKIISYTHMIGFTNPQMIITEDGGIAMWEMEIQDDDLGIKSSFLGASFVEKELCKRKRLKEILINQGVVSQKELDVFLESQNNKRKLEREAAEKYQEEIERQQYESLKAKFEKE